MTWCICYLSNLDHITESRKLWRFLPRKKYCAGHVLCHINRKPAVNIHPWRPSLITAPYEIGKKHKIQTVTPPRCAKTRQKTSWTLSTKINLSHDTEVAFKVNAKVNYGFSIDGFFNFLIKLSTSWLCVILSHRKKLLVHLRVVKLKQVTVVYGTTILVHS